ncbi:hypothetical protein Aglo01_38310 [Actinokineospora globicatena]|nr:hypothetical protein Aglo01_38310 [Actinokineospora globicatena]GLW86241.1 hypothetical protein Aglo02_38800 [Actinokineospora globicatena]
MPYLQRTQEQELHSSPLGEDGGPYRVPLGPHAVPRLVSANRDGTIVAHPAATGISAGRVTVCHVRATSVRRLCDWAETVVPQGVPGSTRKEMVTWAKG